MGSVFTLSVKITVLLLNVSQMFESASTTSFRLCTGVSNGGYALCLF